MTGRQFEKEFLGHCLWHWQGNVPFEKALNRVKESQPWDPTDPGLEANSLANNLHAYVCLELGLEDWSQVALYTAIGSPLDRWHGVDGFFEFKGEVVTIDVTTDPRKFFTRLI